MYIYKHTYLLQKRTITALFFLELPPSLNLFFFSISLQSKGMKVDSFLWILDPWLSTALQPNVGPVTIYKVSLIDFDEGVLILYLLLNICKYIFHSIIFKNNLYLLWKNKYNMYSYLLYKTTEIIRNEIH